MSDVTGISGLTSASAGDTSLTGIKAAVANLNADKLEGPSSSVDSEVALFSSTTGKLLKRASSSGLLLLTSGVASAISTSAALAAAISDETGSGSLVFGTSPTLVTPTIASLANATHTHQNAAGGGTLDAAAIAAGTMATARLGSGTANSSSYLRGDQTWSTISAVTYAPNTDQDNTYWTQVIPMNATSGTAIQGWTLGTNNVVQYPAAHVTMVGSSSADFTATTPLPGNGSTDTYSPTLSKIIRLKMRVRAQDTSDRKGWGFCITAANIHTAQTDVTNGEIRFILNASTLYAQNANGTTATITDVSSGITMTNWNTYEIVFNPGTSALFYINGTLVATHTTNLPTTGTLLHAYGANANGRSLYMFPPVVSIQC